MTKPYVGDTGTVITLDCGRDISAASARAIEVRGKPDGTTTSWAAVASGSAIALHHAGGQLGHGGPLEAAGAHHAAVGRLAGETAVLDVYTPFG